MQTENKKFIYNYFTCKRKLNQLQSLSNYKQQKSVGNNSTILRCHTYLIPILTLNLLLCIANVYWVNNHISSERAHQCSQCTWKMECGKCCTYPVSPSPCKKIIWNGINGNYSHKITTSILNNNKTSTVLIGRHGNKYENSVWSTEVSIYEYLLIFPLLKMCN